MITKLFTTTANHRLFDPMPLPRRIRISIGRITGGKGRYSSSPVFARAVRRISTYN